MFFGVSNTFTQNDRKPDSLSSQIDNHKQVAIFTFKINTSLLTASQHIELQNIVRRHFKEEADVAYIFGQVEAILGGNDKATKEKSLTAHNRFIHLKKLSKQKINRLKKKKQNAEFILIIGSSV